MGRVFAVPSRSYVGAGSAADANLLDASTWRRYSGSASRSGSLCAESARAAFREGNVVRMNQRAMSIWFRAVAIILVLFGLLYVVFGLKIFSYGIPLIPHDILLPWESALYGAIMLGWGVTLLLVGRIAFDRGDRDLKRALVLGLAAWLAVEALASAWFGVWFNVGVDLAVFALFAIPLLRPPATSGEGPSEAEKTRGLLVSRLVLP